MADSIGKILVDSILHDDPTETSKKRMCDALGMTGIETMVGEVLHAHRTKGLEGIEVGSQEWHTTNRVLDAEEECWLAAMRAAHVEECLEAQCGENMRCSPLCRLMSSIFIQSTGPMCVAFYNRFSALCKKMMDEAIGEAKKRANAGEA